MSWLVKFLAGESVYRPNSGHVFGSDDLSEPLHSFQIFKDHLWGKMTAATT